jgi:hypothetical protein
MLVKIAGLALVMSLMSIPAQADCVRRIYNNSQCNWTVDGEVWLGSLKFYQPGCIWHSKRKYRRTAPVSGFPVTLPLKLYSGCEFNLEYWSDLGIIRGYLIFKTPGYETRVPYAGYFKSCPSIEATSQHITFNNPSDGSATMTGCPTHRQSRTKRRLHQK